MILPSSRRSEVCFSVAEEAAVQIFVTARSIDIIAVSLLRGTVPCVKECSVRVINSNENESEGKVQRKDTITGQ